MAVSRWREWLRRTAARPDPITSYHRQRATEISSRIDAVERRLLLHEFKQAERLGMTVAELRASLYEQEVAEWGRLAERYIRAGLEPPAFPEPLEAP